MQSGTVQALIYDELAIFQKTSDYEKVLGKISFFRNIAIAVSMSLGGLIASSYGYEVTLLISIAAMLVSSIFPLLLSYAQKKKSSREIRYLIILKNAFRQAGKNPSLLKIIIFTSIFTAIWGTADEFFQLYYELIKLPLKYFGVVGAIGSVLFGFGGFVAFKAKGYLKDRAINLFSFLSGMGLILISLVENLPMLLLLLLILFAVGIVTTLLEGKIQKEINSNERATITCIKEMLSNTEAITLSIFFGLIAKTFGNQYGFFTFGMIIVFTSLLSLFINPQNNKT